MNSPISLPPLIAKRLFLVSGAATFVAGFCTLAVISIIVPSDRRLPDMWHYWSGTLGDALCLPLIAAGVVGGCGRLSAFGSTTLSRWSLVAAGTGAAGGLASQLSWILDPAPRLNWMIVAPHHLSGPGLYHLIFLVAMSAVLTGGTAEFLRRSIEARKLGAGSIVADVLCQDKTVVTLTAVLLFVASVVADSRPSISTMSSLWTVAAVLVVVCAALCIAAASLGRVFYALTPALVASICAAASVVFLINSADARSGVSLLASASAALGGLALKVVEPRRGSVVQNMWIFFPSVAVLCCLASSALPPWVSYVALAGLGILAIASWLYRIKQPQPDTPEVRTIISALGIAALACCVVLVQVGSLTVGGQSALTAIVGFFAVVAVRQLVGRAIIAQWWPLILAERERASDNHSSKSKSFRRTSLKTWSIAVFLGLATFLVLALASYQVVGNSLTLGSRFDWSSIAVLGCVILALVVGVGLLLTTRTDHAGSALDVLALRPKNSIMHIVTGIISLGILTAAIGLCATQVSIVPGFVGFVVPFVLFVLALDTAETTLVNSSVLCLRPPTAPDYLFGVLSGVGAAVLFAWSLTSGGPQESAPSFIVKFIVAALARGLLVQLVGALIFTRGRYAPATLQPLWWSQAQDELARSVLTLIVIAFPVFVVLHSSPDAAVVNFLSVTVPVVVLTQDIFVYSSKRNIDHVYEQSEERFGRRFLLQRTTSPDYGAVFVEAVSFVRRRPRKGSWPQGSPNKFPEDWFFRSMSAHMGFINMIRFALVIMTFVYFVLLLVEQLTGKPDVLSGFSEK